ncbi:MAG: CheR family methyltransferase, partial [Bacteroidota bacterium]
MDITEEDIQLFNYVLKNNSEYDFSNYSDRSLKRRITKILMDNKMDMKMLVKKIKGSSEFVENIVQRITVNTSELFRDPDVWQDIKYRILPKYKNRNLINIWHAGCSLGQEVYSMLIILNELGLLDKARVYASDLNNEALEKAKKGQYKYRFNIGYLDNFDKAVKENPMDFGEYKDVPYSN